ncbi:hypothetical protein JHW43_005990 [Diplocarpon mali]|nr:hypothetical protein JHW43_005990 [Diplocarpon mali]
MEPDSKNLQQPELQQPEGGQALKSLPILDPTVPHVFVKPIKKIYEGHDVPSFLTSQAYRDIGIFVMQLNKAMCPRKSSEPGQSKTWPLDSPITLSEPVRKLQELLQSIGAIIEEAPPDTGPRRFGNISFRKWFEILESRIPALLKSHLPKSVLDFNDTSEGGVSVLDELTPYLMGGFGSSQRLDYGTGHELSFLAFLGCIWKLGGFTTTPSHDGAVERSIVLCLVEPQPAGSHGVWGLDDHSFLPYIFGSSQYCPPIAENDPMPLEGAISNCPKPGDIAKKSIVDRQRKHNMYFSAVGFINDVKTGPFWEHSPILFDISGVRSGWGKINKGMIKMYHAEVLSKFPVVQHFPFGSLFSWEQDPNADEVAPSVHTANQPSSNSGSGPATSRHQQESTRAAWTNLSGGATGATGAPWAAIPTSGNSGSPFTRAPWVAANGGNSPGRPLPNTGARTRAPWADQ